MVIITFKYRHKKLIIISVLCFLFIIGLTILLINNKSLSKDKEEKEIVVEEDKNLEKKQKDEKKDLVSVDIKGEVNVPGLYQASPNSRVLDIINLAGGLTENANTTVINLSKKIVDEMVIIIYSNEEVADFKKTKELEEKVLNSCLQKDSDSLINNACINSETNTSTDKISINNATKEQLMTLPGIGEAKAEEIIRYRESNGSFKAIEDLMNINGIGESVFAKIKDHITL